MKQYQGKKYITIKEAAYRYGYSVKWFQQKRWLKQPPASVKLPDCGYVYYDLEEIDKFFQEKFHICDL